MCIQGGKCGQYTPMGYLALCSNGYSRNAQGCCLTYGTRGISVLVVQDDQKEITHGFSVSYDTQYPLLFLWRKEVNKVAKL